MIAQEKDFPSVRAIDYFIKTELFPHPPPSRRDIFFLGTPSISSALPFALQESPRPRRRRWRPKRLRGGARPPPPPPPLYQLPGGDRWDAQLDAAAVVEPPHARVRDGSGGNPARSETPSVPCRVSL